VLLKVVDAYKTWVMLLKIIVRLQGTNAAIARLIDNSGMPILSAVEFQEAAESTFLNYKYSYI
jgi:succinyl-CoA synthetase beta subunit